MKTAARKRPAPIVAQPTAPQRWAGATVVCIASGPSLTMEDVEFVRERQAAGACKVIVVNREFATAPWADVLYVADYRCWEEYIVDIRAQFKGELWTIDDRASRQYKLNLIERSYGEGYSGRVDAINTGGNSGFQAVHLAASWGAKRVIILGYDMQRTGGKEHHFGKHRGRLHNGASFSLWIAKFKPLVTSLKAHGVELLNVTRTTALPSEWIPRKRIEEVQW